MWKLVLDSAPGTSHAATQTPCQDSCAVLEVGCASSRAIVAVAADGAGSAVHSAEGARIVCQTMTALVREFFDAGQTIAEIDHDCMLSWLSHIQYVLQQEASLMQCDMADLACTLLVAIVDEDCAVFTQVGDGAIVIDCDQNEFITVFWPHEEEYLNVTHFITSFDLPEVLQYAYFHRPINKLALLTDGLQMVALNMAERTAHPPFFSNFFDRICGEESVEDLNRLLNQFLESGAVNKKTDDDKTLVLMARMAREPAYEPAI